jgi:hypothetical protein
MMRQRSTQNAVGTITVAQAGDANKVFLVKIFWGLIAATMFAGVQMGLMLWQ